MMSAQETNDNLMKCYQSNFMIMEGEMGARDPMIAAVLCLAVAIECAGQAHESALNRLAQSIESASERIAEAIDAIPIPSGGE